MKKKVLHILWLVLVFSLVLGNIAFASTPFVGEIKLFAGNFPPAGWAFCNGAFLQISENETLFQLIGTTFGGNGVTYFALPDLRGLVPVGKGSGYILGEIAGVEQNTLTTANLTTHSHMVNINVNATTVNIPVSTQSGITDAPGDTTNLAKVYDATGDSKIQAYTTAAADTTLKPIDAQVNLNIGGATATASIAGGGQPFDNMQPCLALNYIISLYGIFPTQN